MPSLLQTLLKVPAAFIEAGVKLMDTSTVALREKLEEITGRDGDMSHDPPVDGPRNAQSAVADFGNAIVRIGATTPLGVDDIVAGAGDLLRIARRSLSYRDLNDPRILAMPLELPLNAGAIMADVMMKLITIYSAGGAQRTLSLMSDAFDIFSDVQIYMTLQYKEQIVRYEERVKKEPGDYATRLQLGRMYIKCGLYDQAVPMLESAARNPSTLARASHELLVAHYRAGQADLAIRAGVQAMSANPDNERTRNVLWLASRAAGGYPESVPPEFRMEVKCGYAKPTVSFVDIAPRIGIHKTNAVP